MAYSKTRSKSSSRAFSKESKMSEEAKSLGDALGVVTTAGAFMEFLPTISALFTAIWFGIRIYETDTVQEFLKKFRP
jgi:hypothetical protein